MPARSSASSRSSPRRPAKAQVAKFGSRVSAPVISPPSSTSNSRRVAACRAPERARDARSRTQTEKATAAAPLLGTSKQKRIDPRPIFDEQDAAAPSTKLVAAERNEVRALRDRN